MLIDGIPHLPDSMLHRIQGSPERLRIRAHSAPAPATQQLQVATDDREGGAEPMSKLVGLDMLVVPALAIVPGLRIGRGSGDVFPG